MKKLLSIATTVLLTAAAFMICVSPSTTQAGKPPSHGKKKGPVVVPVDTNDRISAVHLSSITVNVFSAQKSQEYKITPQTKITINGMEGKLSGLTTGMDVTVTAAPNDPGTAQSIDAKTAKH